MPSYKIVAAKTAAAPSRHRVVCRDCARTLGHVTADAEHDGMAAELVAAMWPEVQERVQ